MPRRNPRTRNLACQHLRINDETGLQITIAPVPGHSRILNSNSASSLTFDIIIREVPDPRHRDRLVNIERSMPRHPPPQIDLGEGLGEIMGRMRVDEESGHISSRDAPPPPYEARPRARTPPPPYERYSRASRNDSTAYDATISGSLVDSNTKQRSDRPDRAAPSLAHQPTTSPSSSSVEHTEPSNAAPTSTDAHLQALLDEGNRVSRLFRNMSTDDERFMATMQQLRNLTDQVEAYNVREPHPDYMSSDPALQTLLNEGNRVASALRNMQSDDERLEETMRRMTEITEEVGAYR